MQPFIAAAVYAGSKPGYVFSMRDRGLGYYLDSSMTQPEAPAHWRAYRDANNQLYWAREGALPFFAEEAFCARAHV